MAEDTIIEQPKVEKKKAEKKPYVMAVGRRREAVARVRLYEDIKTGIVWGDAVVKKGEMYVNNLPIEKYFSFSSYQPIFKEPFRTTNTQNRFAVTIKVVGGGKSGQLGAVVHGLARALEKADPSFRPILKKKGFLTRDARTRQRRNVGMGGKSRRKKQSPKR